MQCTTVMGFRGTACHQILETAPGKGDAQQNQPLRSTHPKFMVPLAASRRREVTADALYPPVPPPSLLPPWARAAARR